MKISLNWIQDFVDLPKDLTPEQISYDLTMSTVEVEEVIDLKKNFESILVGKVVELKPHPDADKLRIAMTDLGELGIKQVVCGGENLEQGMYVAVAIPGAKVRWHGEGDLVKLKETKIRGEASFGMICASCEVGLADLYPEKGEKDIMDLSARPADAGTPLADYLDYNDIILDIDNKSLTNRPDLWGHYGMAREFSAIYKVPLKDLPNTTVKNTKKDNLKINIEDPKRCNRYIGTTIDNIKVEESPLWMKARLAKVGQRPINLLVDITNYAMFTVGQPLHAFDSREIKDNTINIRLSKNETLTLLDDKEIEISNDDLVIADSSAPLALAGVMGGKNSGVSNDTTKIILEAAHFSHLNIRRTARNFGLRTESSMRFEKGIDSNRAKTGSDFFIHTLKQIQPDMQITAHADEYPVKSSEIKIEVALNYINTRIGHDFTAKDVTSTLELLGYVVKEKKEVFTITVPEFRATGDISLQEDIVEEIARIHGLDNLDFIPPQITLTSAISTPTYSTERQIREFLSFTAGLNEVFTYPWMENKFTDAIGIDTSDAFKLSDPPSPETENLKTSLLPNLLQAVSSNVRYFDSFGLFEIGRIFTKDEDLIHSSKEENLPNQPKIIAGVVTNKDEKTAFLKAKGALEGLSKLTKINFRFLDSSNVKYAKGNVSLSISANGKEVGLLCLIADRVLRKADVKHANVAYFEINFTELAKLNKPAPSYKELAKFPEIDFELSVLFDEKVAWSDISSIVKKSNSLIKEVSFFTEYQGKQLPEGKKSVSFNMKLADKNATLTSEQSQEVMDNVLTNLNKKLGGELRS